MSRPTDAAALLLAGAFCVVGTFGTVGSWVVYRMDGTIARTGERADGHVTRKSVVRAADDTDYTIDYWFALPGGARVEATRGIGRELWSAVRTGDVLTVRYSAADPKRNFPEQAGHPGLGMTVFVSAVCAAVAVLGALVLSGLVRRRPAGGPSAHGHEA
ncbi:MAG: DUF3592 domain-containing protein [Vicinamibacteria bacterium]